MKKRKRTKPLTDEQRNKALGKRSKYLKELGYKKDGKKWTKEGKTFTPAKVQKDLARYEKTRKSDLGKKTIKWLDVTNLNPAYGYDAVYEILRDNSDSYSIAMALRDWYSEVTGEDLDHHRSADWYMIAIE